MSHTVTCKLNKEARQHQNASGVTFFVSLGEKNYNFQTQASEWTNYEAALFAKDNQIAFYQSALVEGSIVSVSSTGLIMEPQTDPQYKPKLKMVDAKLEFVHSAGQPIQQGQPAPQQQGGFAPQQPVQGGQGMAAQQQGGFAPQGQQVRPHPQNAARTAPQGQQPQAAPQPANNFDNNDIPY